MTIMVGGEAGADRAVSGSKEASGARTVELDGDLDRDLDVEMIAQLPAAQRDDALLRIEREIRALHAQQLAIIAAVDTNRRFTDDGHRTAAGWVQAVLNTSAGRALRMVQIARMLADVAEFRAGAHDGSIGPDQLDRLRRLHSNARARPFLAGSGELLAEHARTLVAEDFAKACHRWNAHADPDGWWRDHDAARDHRGVTLVRHPSGYELIVRGDAGTGDTIKQLIDAQTTVEFDADVAQRQRDHTVDAEAHPLQRTDMQRRHDALVALITGAARGAGVMPVVNILCTEESLTDALRSARRDAAGHGPRRRSRRRAVDAPVRSDSPSPLLDPRLHLSETEAGAPILPGDLVIAALIGQVRRVVIDSASRPIDLGRKRRLFTGAAREAALLMGQQCSFHGCRAGPNELQLDHMTPWAAMHGTTSPLNAAPACGPHNRSKHELGHTTTRDETGWHHFRRDGSEIAPRPRRRRRPPDDS